MVGEVGIEAHSWSASRVNLGFFPPPYWKEQAAHSRQGHWEVGEEAEEYAGETCQSSGCCDEILFHDYKEAVVRVFASLPWQPLQADAYCFGTRGMRLRSHRCPPGRVAFDTHKARPFRRVCRPDVDLVSMADGLVASSSRAAHVDGYDICHRCKGGQSGANLGVKAGILDLLRLVIVNTSLLALFVFYGDNVLTGR